MRSPALFVFALVLTNVLQPLAAQEARKPAWTGDSAASADTRRMPTERKALEIGYGNLPLSFEENRGQFDARVDFVARGRGYNIALTAAEAVLGIDHNRTEKRSRGGVHRDAVPPTRSGHRIVGIRLAGANAASRAVGLDELPGRANYYEFGAKHSVKKTENVPTFSRVRYADVYPGIDVVYYGSARDLEYDFVIAPGADPGAIRLRIEGADRIALDRGGDLLIRTHGTTIRQHEPVLYQEANGIRTRVAGKYKKVGASEIAFAVGRYDRHRPLIVDPIVVSYGTYLGGDRFDTVKAVAVDASGNAYVTGQTQSSNFPWTSAPTWTAGDDDGFIAKLNPSGTALLYATYFISAGYYNIGNDIKVDAAGDAYVTGQIGPGNTVLIMRVGPTGTWKFDVELGTSGGNNWGNGIAIDGAGYAYVTGLASPAFDITTGSYQQVSGGGGDAFVAKINTNVSWNLSIVYSTYLGGVLDDEGYKIAIDNAGAAYVTGTTFGSFPTTSSGFQTTNGGGMGDAFVAKLSADGSTLLYSTFLGGSYYEIGKAIAVDASHNVYIGGYAEGDYLPTTPGSYHPTWNLGNCAVYPVLYKSCSDGFVAKFNPSATGNASLIYSTYLGGTNDDSVEALTIDPSGNVFVSGTTWSLDFPQLNPISGFSSGNGFITELNAAGSALLFSSYFTGRATGLARCGALGSLYIAGSTTSTTGIATTGVFQTSARGDYDGFVARFNGFPPDSGTAPTITTQPQSRTIAPGQTAPLTVVASGTAPLYYQWYAGTSGTTTSPISGATSSAYTTPALTATARYWVRVSNTSGAASSSTATILVSFTDDPLVARTTAIRAIHITELRNRINAVRARLNLSAFVWTDPTLSSGTRIRAVHITDLRTALAQAYAAASLTAPSYTDASLISGMTVKVAHIAELRTALVAIE